MPLFPKGAKGRLGGLVTDGCLLACGGCACCFKVVGLELPSTCGFNLPCFISSSISFSCINCCCFFSCSFCCISTRGPVPPFSRSFIINGETGERAGLLLSKCKSAKLATGDEAMLAENGCLVGIEGTGDVETAGVIGRKKPFPSLDFFQNVAGLGTTVGDEATVDLVIPFLLVCELIKLADCERVLAILLLVAVVMLG